MLVEFLFNDTSIIVGHFVSKKGHRTEELIEEERDSDEDKGKSE